MSRARPATGRRMIGGLAVAAVAAAAPPAAAAADEPPTRPSLTNGATTAQIVAATHARARPGAGRRIARVATVTSWSGHAQRLLVLAARDDWVKVRLPIRPNGTAAWVPRDKVVLRRERHWIRLRLATRRITVYRDGRRLRSFRAVIGAPGTPTPRGLHAIYERNRQPDPGGFLGPWSLSLTALSNVLESFGGGPGRVAIHGREGASLRDPLGSARSHGCVRIDSRAVRWLARHARPGTPVDVR
ncbi:MAG TPA: L,D-transpeptidase [Solirubrobacteraceae bacterium]|nr:L,D-transpeptidase [Solirubrobacteraceae bacterium]